MILESIHCSAKRALAMIVEVLRFVVGAASREVVEVTNMTILVGLKADW